ncbi:uncharacterized protein [Ptychodera flava]|uniref:uncharacterized protein n=1 Tax=Ptychodera flava TaxID=63121 RepID=UPI00396A17B7
MSSFMTDDTMIAVAEMSDFLDNLPDGFEYSFNGSILHDPARLNVFLHSSQYDRIFTRTFGGIIKVADEDELEEWRERVLSKPLFLDVMCFQPLTINYSTQAFTRHFAVFVNTKHPQIRSQIERGFTKAKCYMKQGIKFSVELDFSGPVRGWYSDVTQNSLETLLGDVDGKYGSVSILNHRDNIEMQCDDSLRSMIIYVSAWCCFIRLTDLDTEERISVGAEVKFLRPDDLITLTLSHRACVTQPVRAPPPTYEEPKRHTADSITVHPPSGVSSAALQIPKPQP